MAVFVPTCGQIRNFAIPHVPSEPVELSWVSILSEKVLTSAKMALRMFAAPFEKNW